MRVVMFYHSLVSDWNHGNAHFLRGIATELLTLGHEVEVFEPCEGWSRRNLLQQHGPEPVRQFETIFPQLRSQFYDLESLDLETMLDGADLVLVHEWNDPVLVNSIGKHRRSNPYYRLLFHDTHHRAVTAPAAMAAFELRHYDGVLAYGEVLRRMYVERGWAPAAWTWHEAADTRIFRPVPQPARTDLVWIGNWGDEERSRELREYLLDPVAELGVNAIVHGVRYPAEALAEFAAAGIHYAGWLPNYLVPRAFGAARLTVHVPRRPYVESLPGIPTIRPFEALACGIPLVSAYWADEEGLFTPGEDFLMARNGQEMREQLRLVLNEPELAHALAEHGLRTVQQRHTCRHRARELMAICAELGLETEAATAA